RLGPPPIRAELYAFVEDLSTADRGCRIEANNCPAEVNWLFLENLHNLRSPRPGSTRPSTPSFRSTWVAGTSPATGHQRRSITVVARGRARREPEYRLRVEGQASLRMQRTTSSMVGSPSSTAR